MTYVKPALEVYQFEKFTRNPISKVCTLHASQVHTKSDFRSLHDDEERKRLDPELFLYEFPKVTLLLCLFLLLIPSKKSSLKKYKKYNPTNNYSPITINYFY